MTAKALPISDVPELRLLHPPSLRIAPNSRVPLTNGIAAIIDHPLFQRLRGVRQLGFADRVYPSATHTRFEHSLGVYFRAIHYVHALWGDDFAGEYFRDKVRPRDIRSLLAAALLHDLGQYPYSHVLEDVDRDHNGTLPATSAFSHEALTANLLTQPTFRQDVLRECASGAPDFQHALDSLGVSAEDVASILEGRAFGDLTPAATGILHSIVDGPIDADKLDYLQRDSHHAGVAFGSAIDEHRFYQSLTLVYPELQPADDVDDKAPAIKHQIGITEKGRVPAEEILIARQHMFSELYWHRTTRAQEAVLATAIRRLRSVAPGFDDWFRKVVLDPRASDEWFLSLCHKLASRSDSADLRIKYDGTVSPLVEKSAEMLSSLSFVSGRAPFKRLMSVSGADDPTLYDSLQTIRALSLRQGTPLLDSLTERIATGIGNAFKVDVHPFDLVMDVPARRAPANTVWIVSTNTPRKGFLAPLAERSKMWREFGESFDQRTRKMRLFCPAALRREIRENSREGINELKLYEIVREAALLIARDAVQLEIFGEEPAQ